MAIASRRWVRWLGGGILAASIALFVVWRLVFPTPAFPLPAGPYGIGTRLYDWTDASRPEPFTPDRTDRRRLVVQVWYPAVSSSGPPQPYLENDAVTAALALRFHLPGVLFSAIRHAPTHAVRDAPAAGGRFPVLINPTGFSGFRTASLFWIEALVSRGYVVVGLDQPGTAAATVFPDGTVIPMMADKVVFDQYMPLALAQSPAETPRLNGVALPGGIIPFLADDLRFVLDQLVDLDRADPVLAGRLDLGHAGVFGMSLGGYISAEARRRDERFGACLAVDSGHTAAVAAGGLNQPLMIMSRDAGIMRQERARAGGWPEPEIAFTLDSQRAAFAHNRGDAYYVTMNGMFHVNWTDAPIWTPIVGWAGLAGPIDPYRGFADTNALTLAFFDRYLRGTPSPVLAPTAAGEAGWRLESRLAPATPAGSE